MKKTVFFLFCLLSSAAFLYGDNPAVNYMLFLRNAKMKYYKIEEQLNTAVELINKKGTEAFKELKKTNSQPGSFSLFVIDPISGKLLVAPHAKKIGKDALKNSSINGKAIAQEAIKEARIKLGKPKNWFQGLSGDLYRNYFYRLAITLEGKVYVVAISESGRDLQRLFVTVIVDKACKLLQEFDQKKAFEIFSKKNGLFYFEDTYLFVYRVDSEKDVICLYNPNYPDTVGKNIINLKINSVYIIQEILKILKGSNKGWIRSYTHIPGQKYGAPKDTFIESVTVNGKKLVVGSGVYLYK